jgi:hypothetical protein
MLGTKVVPCSLLLKNTCVEKWKVPAIIFCLLGYRMGCVKEGVELSTLLIREERGEEARTRSFLFPAKKGYHTIDVERREQPYGRRPSVTH